MPQKKFWTDGYGFTNTVDPFTHRSNNVFFVLPLGEKGPKNRQRLQLAELRAFAASQPKESDWEIHINALDLLLEAA